MTTSGPPEPERTIVMAGHDPPIQAYSPQRHKDTIGVLPLCLGVFVVHRPSNPAMASLWMAGSSPAMTTKRERHAR